MTQASRSVWSAKSPSACCHSPKCYPTASRSKMEIVSVGNVVAAKPSNFLKDQQPSTSGSQQIQYQCILKGRPSSNGGSSLWRRSVSLHRNPKTERSSCGMGRERWAIPSDGGFAPAPPGFSALVPLPMRGTSIRELWGKGMPKSIPLNRSKPLSRRSGCFPAWALSSAQLGLIITAACARSRRIRGVWHFILGERSGSRRITSPQGGNSRE